MKRRDRRHERLALLAISAVAGTIKPDEVTELGRLYFEVGGTRQAGEKDRRIREQRVEIARLQQRVTELEAEQGRRRCA